MAAVVISNDGPSRTGTVAFMFLFAAFLTATWWLTSLDRFHRPGATVGLPVAVGEDANAGVGIGGYGPPFTVFSATPVVRAGSVEADIVVRVCEGSDDGMIGASRGDLREQCDQVYPVAGAVLSHFSQQLVVTVTPRERGEIFIDGYELVYGQGWRWGAQWTGMNVEVRGR